MQPSPSWPERDAAEQAMRELDRRVTGAPDDLGARVQRAALLDLLGHREAARQACLDVLACDMTHAGALGQLAALLVADGFTTAARTVLAQAIAAHPDDPAPRVVLGQLMRAAGEADAARAQFDAALRADPAQPEAHQGLSYLLDGVDDAAASRHRALGFDARALTTRAHRGPVRPVVVLQLVSARGGNVPTRYLLDDRTFLVHTLVVDQTGLGITLPAHDLVFNAIGDAERCGEALQKAGILLAGSTAPIINPPERIRGTTRAGNARRLGELEGVRSPCIVTASRVALADGLPDGFAYPCLLRSPGFHTGRNFLRLETAADLAPAVQALPGETLMVIELLDARAPDDTWRKYRVMIVGDALLPMNLAISRRWMVHHSTSGMESCPAARAEEAAFLADMPGVLGVRTMAALARIRDTLRLDFGGIDFGLGPEGEILLFEANATMVVVPPVPGSVFAYLDQPVANVVAAVRELLLDRGGRA